MLWKVGSRGQRKIEKDGHMTFNLFYVDKDQQTAIGKTCSSILIA